MNNVSVIIPALNEEEPIAGVVREVVATKILTDIIVVDNGSTDRTAERAREAGARRQSPSRIRSCVLRRSGGAAAGMRRHRIPRRRRERLPGVYESTYRSNCAWYA